MTSQVITETNYTRALKQILETAGEPAWLKLMRENAFARFTEAGFPTVTQEDWKYTNVAPAVKDDYTVFIENKNLSAEDFAAFEVPESRQSRLVFYNGRLHTDLSDVSSLPANVSVKSFADALQDEADAETVKKHLARIGKTEENGFTALNAALWQDGAFIFVPKNTKVEQPIQLLFVSDAESLAVFPRVLVVLERGAEAEVIESYARAEETKYLTDAVVEVALEDDARLTHLRVQRESHTAFHIGTTNITLGRTSFYDSTNINFGAAIARHNIGLKLTAEGAECFVDGLYMVGGEQHTDTHSTIEHLVPRCTSHQTYKGVLSGKSRAVFNGKVFVAEGAHGTDGYQQNKNLLLSNDARVDTKPQLEIFNDDVKCSHGATVGQLEEEELFYLLSRGLNEGLARNLLTYGFAEEVINKIKIESIKKQLDEAVLNRLEVRV
jgi:Fe-S cluster assembly protein SufD